MRNSLRLWFERSETTVKTRNLVQKYKVKANLVKTQSVFSALVANFRNTKRFATCLSNIAAKFDHLMK